MAGRGSEQRGVLGLQLAGVGVKHSVRNGAFQMKSGLEGAGKRQTSSSLPGGHPARGGLSGVLWRIPLKYRSELDETVCALDFTCRQMQPSIFQKLESPGRRRRACACTT